MSDKTWWETIKVQGGELVDTVKKLVREGNVRRHSSSSRVTGPWPNPADGGGVGAVSPCPGGDWALAALINECSIAVERYVPAAGEQRPRASILPQPRIRRRPCRTDSPWTTRRDGGISLIGPTRLRQARARGRSRPARRRRRAGPASDVASRRAMDREPASSGPLS